jgi:hypothetical protein
MAKRTAWAQRRRAGFRHATVLVRDVCEIAGLPSLVEGARAELADAGVLEAIQRHDNAVLFDWLIDAMSYQGVSNAAAYTYMQEHGRVYHHQIQSALGQRAACSKLKSWWHFEHCGYRKTARTCNRPELLGSCPLPSHDLRNGSLNQAAYGLALFIRDIAEGDLVRWIDRCVEQADGPGVGARGKRMAASVIEPLRHVHGLSDKVLSMSLSMLLLAGDPRRERWITAASSMIAIDTLVHSWFVRTGILRRLDSQHAYGPDCYGQNGCAAIIERLSDRIDARRFNAEFPANFPRFVQHAIWHFCAQSGLAECNGLNIHEGTKCRRRHCGLFELCDRVTIPRADTPS